MKKLTLSSSCSAALLLLLLGAIINILQVHCMCQQQYSARKESADETTNSSSSSSSSSELIILSLLPYPNTLQPPSWDEGHTLSLAAELAVERLNSNPDILPGHNLTLITDDTGCNIRSRATLAVVNTLNRSELVVGAVGPGCSVSATTVGPLLGKDKIALVTVHIAGSLLLADRDKYPFSFGTLDSTEVFVDTLLALMRDREWNNVSALYDESRLYYYSTVQVMEGTLRANTSLVEDYFFSAVYDTYIPLELIKNRYKVVFLFVGPDFLSKILCLALKQGMVYPVYQFVIVSRVVDEIVETEFTYNGERFSCNDKDIKKVIDKMIIIHYQLQPLNTTKKTVSGLSYEEFERLYRERVEEFRERTGLKIYPSFWASSYFDAVWSLGLALHSSMSEVDLSLYACGDLQGSKVIRESLRQLDYEGTSGNIKFDNETGYARRNVNIYQVSEGKDMSYIGYYNKTNGNLSFTTKGDFVADEFEHATIVRTAPKFLAGLVLPLTALGLVLVLVLQILTVYYREYKTVKASSPKLSQLAFIGCYILILGSFTNVCADLYTDLISPDTNCVLWHLLNIATATGSTLVFGTICVRTYRLYRIFMHFEDPGRLLSEKILVFLVLIFTVLDLAICIAWVKVDPFHPHVIMEDKEFREIRGETGKMENVLIVQRVIHSCTQNNFLLWCLSLIFFNTVLLAAAVVLALLTRRIPFKIFKTRGIMNLTYILTAILGLGVAIYTILLLEITYSTIVLRFVIMSVLFNLYIYLSCLLLFLPPLFPMLYPKLAAAGPLFSCCACAHCWWTRSLTYRLRGCRQILPGL